MPVGFRGATGIVAQSGTNGPTVTLPGTVAAEDSMWAVSTFSGTTQTLTAPAGWSIVAGPIDKGTVMRSYLLSKVATGGDAGASVAFTWSATTATRTTEVIVMSGTDPTTPLHASASKVETSAGTTHVSPTVTVTEDGCWIIEFIIDRGSPASASFTPGSGMSLEDTQVATGGGALSSAVADSAGDVPQGTAGGETWTGTVSTANCILWTVAVAPDAAVAATPTPSVISGAVVVNAPTVSAPSPATATPAVISRPVSIPTLIATITSTVFPDPISRAVSFPAPTIIASISAVVAMEEMLVAAAVPAPTVVTTSAVVALPDVITATATVLAPAIQVAGSATAPPSLISRVVTMPSPSLKIGQSPIIATMVRPVVMIVPRINVGTVLPLWREWNGAAEVILTVAGVWDGTQLVPATNVEIAR